MIPGHRNGAAERQEPRRALAGGSAPLRGYIAQRMGRRANMARMLNEIRCAVLGCGFHFTSAPGFPGILPAIAAAL